jgi:hypothetical protein
MRHALGLLLAITILGLFGVGESEAACRAAGDYRVTGPNIGGFLTLKEGSASLAFLCSPLSFCAGGPCCAKPVIPAFYVDDHGTRYHVACWVLPDAVLAGGPASAPGEARLAVAL